MELNPDSTVKEIATACEVGSVTKILLDVPVLGYGIKRGHLWRDVVCDGATRSRRVRIYAPPHRQTA
jgi:hypothetical protein